MALLLDTHVFIWWRAEPGRLSAHVRASISDADSVQVSLASAWEAAIKAGTGKLKLAASFEDGIRASSFSPLQITFRHITAVQTLPMHHRDPFDRMLIAQALVEGLTLVTHDARLTAYNAPLLLA